MKTNYHKIYLEELEKVKQSGKKATLLLHSCCAPCSSATLEKLVPYFDITIYYYNPNITDKNEYIVRLNEQNDFLQKAYNGAVKLVEGEYNVQDFFTAIKGKENLGEKSIRCYECYSFRLEESAKKCKELGFDYFTTTLSISPHKRVEWINEIGKSLANKYSINFLVSDFKKENGYKRSIELSKEYSLYRQDYCGCEYSKKESIKKDGE